MKENKLIEIANKIILITGGDGSNGKYEKVMEQLQLLTTPTTDVEGIRKEFESKYVYKQNEEGDILPEDKWTYTIRGSYPTEVFAFFLPYLTNTKEEPSRNAVSENVKGDIENKIVVNGDISRNEVIAEIWKDIEPLIIVWADDNAHSVGRRVGDYFTKALKTNESTSKEGK